MSKGKRTQVDCKGCGQSNRRCLDGIFELGLMPCCAVCVNSKGQSHERGWHPPTDPAQVRVEEREDRL